MGLWQQLRGGCSTLGWCTVASTGSCGWLRQRNRAGMSATFLLVPRQGVIRINIFKELLCKSFVFVVMLSQYYNKGSMYAKLQCSGRNKKHHHTIIFYRTHNEAHKQN